MKKNKIKILAIGILILLLFLGILEQFIYREITSFVQNPANPSAHDKLFTIHSGQSLKDIAHHLEKESIISNQSYFVLFARFKKAEKKLQAGEYLLSASKSPEQILEVLLKGKVNLYRLTIPEGLNFHEVAALVEKAGFCSKIEFEDLCRNKSFIMESGIKSTSLEGYLFPDTYFFPKLSSCKTIISTMILHFKTIFTEQWKEQAKLLGFSIHDIVTLASIIEKETGDAKERPLIASVFHNRLKKNMRLESDPTVIYGIKEFDGNIKKKHLETLTPYNTYKIKGLPPGPIANPGAMSLQAALYPARTEYLFFVSKKDTTHQFSKTIQDHNRAVKTFQLRKK